MNSFNNIEAAIFTMQAMVPVGVPVTGLPFTASQYCFRKVFPV